MDKKEIVKSIKRRIYFYELEIIGLESLQKKYLSDSNIYKSADARKFIYNERLKELKDLLKEVDF